MMFVEVKAMATEYHLLCFKFGGEGSVSYRDDFFTMKGYGSYNYIAGIVLGPNPSLLVDAVGGKGDYATERAGFVNAGDLAAAWQHILRFFDKIPERCVLNVVRSADDDLGWTVESCVPMV